MATFTLEEIGQRVSRLPPLADPVFDAALAFITGLGGIENLKREHVIDPDDETLAPLSTAITKLVDYQTSCWNWADATHSNLKPTLNQQAPAEYGL